MIIKENILHHEEHKTEEVALQATTVNVQPKNKKYTVKAVYYPPRYKLDKRDCLNYILSGRVIITL